MYRLISILGLLFMMLIAYGLSTNRKRIRLKIIIWGVALQFIFALLILRTHPVAFGDR